MSLNIFPRRDTRQQTPAVAEPPLQPETEQQPVNSDDSGDQDDADTSSRRRTTRGRRGSGSSRSSSAASTPTKTADEPAEDTSGESAQKSASSRSRSRSGSSSSSSRSASTSKSKSTGETSDDTGDEAATKKSSSSRASSRQKDTSTDDGSAEQSTSSRSSRSRSRKKDDTGEAAAGPVDTAALLKAVEAQAKQIEELTRTVNDFMKNGGGAAPTGAPPIRVGVFVDVANVELGADRARVKLHWGKILNLLSRDRQLVRAMAYAPVHDDPDVSRETQRFVEPFLDNGYKIVTKHLKRFSDGTIKANVDIEMTLDILNMLDRLDVVCLVSGDGDFEPLVRAAQDRGVRVVVVAMGNSCSNQLRAASDEFIDLQQRLSEVKA